MTFEQQHTVLQYPFPPAMGQHRNGRAIVHNGEAPVVAPGHAERGSNFNVQYTGKPDGGHGHHQL